MNEYLRHPAYIENRQLFVGASEDVEKKVKFEDFLPFILTEGLRPKTTTRFSLFLESLFQQTGSLWQPALCGRTPKFLEAAQTIIKDEQVDDSTIIKMKRYAMQHFWLELKFEGEILLVIDPIGVPESGENLDFASIRPYFGPHKNARNYPLYVYSESVDAPIKREKNTSNKRFYP